jgi:hypothetical protein
MVKSWALWDQVLYIEWTYTRGPIQKVSPNLNPQTAQPKVQVLYQYAMLKWYRLDDDLEKGRQRKWPNSEPVRSKWAQAVTDNLGCTFGSVFQYEIRKSQPFPIGHSRESRVETDTDRQYTQING